jgi:hypothetical protein
LYEGNFEATSQFCEMSKFYFHIRNGDRLARDAEGIELGDIDAVREEATVAAREMIAELVRQGGRIEGHSIEVTDEKGGIVLTIPFRSAMNLD